MTKIEWTEETWNPVVGCSKVSAGCKNCYAERMHKRLRAMGVAKYQRDFGDVWLHVPSLSIPKLKKKPTRYFVNSMSDLFHQGLDPVAAMIVFEVMRTAPQHTYMVLTKRPENAVKWFRWMRARMVGFDDPADHRQILEFVENNVWIGVSVEDQKTADERIPLLLQIPAAVRFVSCEPLLGMVNLCRELLTTRPGGDGTYPFPMLKDEFRTKWLDMIDWVICGGESGPNARPMHPDWARSLRDQCAKANVPFFFKQWGAWAPLFPVYADEDSHIDDERAQELQDELFGQRHEIVLENTGYVTSHWENGREMQATWQPAVGTNPWCMARIGKKAAGRELDGRTHNDCPQGER